MTEPVEPLLTTAEVAKAFRVDPKTVARWALAGKLTTVRTLGGHRRYLASEVRQLLGLNTSTPPDVLRHPGEGGTTGFGIGVVST